MTGIAERPDAFDAQDEFCGDCGREGAIVVRLRGRHDGCHYCGNEIFLCADCLAKLKADLAGFPAHDEGISP